MYWLCFEEKISRNRSDRDCLTNVQCIRVMMVVFYELLYRSVYCQDLQRYLSTSVGGGNFQFGRGSPLRIGNAIYSGRKVQWEFPGFPCLLGYSLTSLCTRHFHLINTSSHRPILLDLSDIHFEIRDLNLDYSPLQMPLVIAFSFFFFSSRTQAHTDTDTETNGNPHYSHSQATHRSGKRLTELPPR